MAEVRRKTAEIIGDRETRDEQCRKALALARDKLETRETRLVDAYVDGVIDEATYRKRNAQLVEDKVALDQRQAALGQDPPALAAKVATFLELAKSALQSYLSGTPEERRELVKLVTSNRTVTENGVDLQPIPALEHLRKREILSFVMKSYPLL